MPELISVLDTRLYQFRQQLDMAAMPPGLTHPARLLVLQQDKIGWHNLLLGFPAKQWKLLQARHYRRLGIQRSARSWMKGFLTRLHQLAWHQWDHRNNCLYDPEGKWQKEMQQKLDDEIILEYSRGIEELPPCDQSHFAYPLNTLLSRALDYKLGEIRWQQT